MYSSGFRALNSFLGVSAHCCMPACALTQLDRSSAPKSPKEQPALRSVLGERFCKEGCKRGSNAAGHCPIGRPGKHCDSRLQTEICWGLGVQECRGWVIMLDFSTSSGAGAGAVPGAQSRCTRGGLASNKAHSVKRRCMHPASQWGMPRAGSCPSGHRTAPSCWQCSAAQSHPLLPLRAAHACGRRAGP